jgi:MFS family permease
MTRPSTRLLAATLIDWTGTGFYLAISAIFLTRSLGLSGGQVGLALAGVGLVAFAGSVPAGRLGDRFGHCEVLCVLHAARAAAFLGLSLGAPLWPALALLGAIGLADQAAASMNQALVGEMVPAEERVAFMGRVRTVINIGVTLGTLPAGFALAAGTDSFAPLLAANGASYLVAGAIVAGLPRRRLVRVAEARRLLVPSFATTALIAVDGVMSLWLAVLNIGLPLWIIGATSAPASLVAVLYGTNTVLCVLLQTRVSRRVATYVGAGSAQRLAGLLLAACCGCFAGSVVGSGPLSTALLVGAIACLTFAELLVSSAAWRITFALAPAGRSAEFFATYGLGKVASQIGGPILLTSVVLVLGSPGWILLGVLFLLGAIVTPPLLRRALERPVVDRQALSSAAWSPARSGEPNTTRLRVAT